MKLLNCYGRYYNERSIPTISNDYIYYVEFDKIFYKLYNNRNINYIRPMVINLRNLICRII